VHGLDAGDQPGGAAEGLEPEHRPHDSPDCSVVLFDDVVEVLRLAQLNVRTAVGAQAGDCRGAAKTGALPT
jgi:hypothetical protein